MSTVRNAWNRRGKSKPFIWLVLAVFILAGMLGILGKTTGAAKAAPNSRKCIGTYLMVEGSGTQSLWTFGTNGTLQITSSAQDVDDAFTDGFSHQQGAWKRAGSGMVKTTTLDFATDGAYAPTSIARVDALVTFSNACQNVSGSFDLRFYPTPADPLDINAASVAFSDTLTGRLVKTD